MGSASREALATAKAALVRPTERMGEELLLASRTIAGSAQLRSVLADPGVPTADKGRILSRVFGAFDAGSVKLLGVLVGERWSRSDELVAGVEELGLRALAASAPAGTNIERELFAFETAVRSNAELELAVSSKLGDAEHKVTLVNRLLTGASSATRIIVAHVVRLPRGRRIGETLRTTAGIVADQAGLGIATVRTARPLAAQQLTRLEKALSVRYGRKLSINEVLDESLVGGVRISIGDDVIDGSVATRLSDLRLQLVG